MPSKRYPKSGDHYATQPIIREAKAESFGREKGLEDFLHNTLSVSRLKRKLKRSVKRSKKEIAWALEIAGIGEGPADLSTNMLKYLSSDK